ncbi:uncharacterized mitochondrial protein-like protein [Tanacetum coccineum]
MVVVLIYVDDVIITGNNLIKIQETKKQLDDEFSIKDLGPLKYFLRIEVAKTRDGLVLSQRKYTLDILEDSGKLGCKPSAFPIEEGLKLDKGESESRVDASQYRRLIGRLLYLQATRTDITYTVNILSQFVADPRNNHLEAANHVLGYLKATPGQGILLSRAGDLILTAYCDSDWRDGKMFGAGLLDFDQILEHLAQDPNMMVANTGETTIDSHAPNTNLFLRTLGGWQSEDPIVNSAGDKEHGEEHTNYVVNIWVGC